MVWKVAVGLLMATVPVGACSTPPSELSDISDASINIDADDFTVCGAQSCNEHGECTVVDGRVVCECDALFAGQRCAECSAGYAGENCSQCTTGFHADSQGTCVADLCDGQSTTRILFIGNSYTAFNNLPDLVGNLAAAENCPVYIESSTPGGARFLTHLSDSGTLAKINVGGWDHVVLQNQSQVPGFRPEDVAATSLPHAQALVTAIRNASPDAEVTYFATWGRRDGDALNCDYYPLVCTFAGHTQALAGGYAMYEAATGNDVASVGQAWKDVVDSATAPFSSETLWATDGSHPTLQGSYLASLVIFGRIFHATAVGTPYDAGLSQLDASFLQDIAGPYARPCGNGAIDGNETCDDSGESTTCNDNCTLHACGDGTHNATAGEECDGGGSNTATCDSDCSLAICGDGFTNLAANEQCDDQGESALCNLNCTTASCSDRIINVSAGEQCDDGNLNNGDFCDQLCQWEPADTYEPDNDPANATAIVPSDSFISGHTILDFNDEDYFSFPVIAGREYLLRTWGNSNFCGANASVDTFVTLDFTLYEPDGTTIITSYEDSPSANPIFCWQIQFTPTQSATYFLAVRSFNSTYGEYHLQVMEIVDDVYAPNASAATAAPVGALPATLTGVRDIGLEDWFSFDATLDQSYSVSITDSNCQSGDASDLRLVVRRADATTVVASDYEAITEICAAVTFTAPASETLLIQILQGRTVLFGQTYTVEVLTP